MSLSHHQRTTLGQCAIINDRAFSPKENWPFVHYLDTGSITDNNIDKFQLIESLEKLPSRARRKVKQGDIVYSTVRPNMRHFGILQELPDNTLVSTGFAVIRGIDKFAHTNYIYWFLTQNETINHLQTLAEHSTSAYPSIRPSDLESLEIILPPFDEQRASAHVLDTLDHKIQLNRRMTKNLEEMARALFKSWFVDFDPVRAKMDDRWQPGQSLPGLPAELYNLFPDRLVPSEIGEIPEGWLVKPLDEIATFTNGLALQKFPATRDCYLPVIKIAEMRKGYTKNTGKASPDINPKYVVEDGDLLFSWSGSLLVVLWTHGKGALNQHLFKVTSVIFPRWFYWGWIQQHLVEFQQIAAGKATTMGHIQRHHLREALVIVPSEDILTMGDHIIMPFLDQYVTKALESRSLAELRDTLLPKLLSGEIRVDTDWEEDEDLRPDQ